MPFSPKTLGACAILMLTNNVIVPNAQQTITAPLLSNSGKLFVNKPNADLYWQALLQAAKKNKAEALKIVALIKSNSAPSANPLVEENHPANIDDFFDNLFLSEISRNPQTLSAIGLLESIGIYEHNAYLNDVSPQAMMLDLEEKKANLQILKTYPLDSLTRAQKISYKIFLWKLSHTVSGEKFLFHDYRINHMFGVLPEITMVFTQFHPLKTAEHVELYLTRLSRVPEQLQQCITLLEHQKKMGIVLPTFALSKIVSIIQNLMTKSVEDNCFYKHLALCMETIETPNKEQLLVNATTIIETLVYPAYQKLQQYIETLLCQSNANRGVWSLPDGDEYYAFLLKYHTSTDLTADQIHEIGLKEVRKIQEEMRSILAREGINNNEKSIGELMQELSHDPRFFYPQTEEGRKQCLADFEKILERSRKELSHLFDLKPKFPVKIQAVPKHDEDGLVVPHYIPSSIDGSRPGVFFVNLRCSFEEPQFTMETLTIHESEPGHHFQISLQQESNMPILRKLAEYTAYVEGWALYAEKLAFEQGFYSSNFSQLGHLQWEIVRAVRLVVDTGIHKKKWTQDEAVNYMEKNTGLPKGTIISEVERYFVIPGQACAYKIGQLKILELRQRAKDALGEKFDIREFHNVVLKIGATPLTVLEEVVDQYIQDKLNT